MKKLGPGVFTIATLILLLLTTPCNGGSTAHLTILHVNDVHGHILPYVEKSIDPDSLMSGGARLAKMIQEERDGNPGGCLLLAAGDMFQGSPISNVFHGRSVIDLMNYLKFDAMVLGNHEFDWGLNVLGDLQSAAVFPFLSANILDGAGKPVLGVKPYITLRRGNLDIAVIGATTPETPYTTKPSNVAGLRFEEPEKVLPAIIEEVRKNGARFVIVLSHLGMPADTELAQQVPGIDVIVGGHSHTVATDSVRVGNTIVVQAGYYSLYLGVLDLKIDEETGKILEYTGKQELKAVKSGPEQQVDKTAEGIVEGYHEKIKAEFSKVVGETSLDLVRRSDDESTMGDLVADSMRESAGTEVAFENAGGLRADILKGPITLEQIYSVLPFDNAIVTMDLTGEQILEVLEKSADMDHRILQVSGLKVEYNLSRPKGARVVKASIGGEAIKPERAYRVATNDFLAAGGDQFATFTTGRNVTVGDSMKDVLIQYIQKHTP